MKNVFKGCIKLILILMLCWGLIIIPNQSLWAEGEVTLSIPEPPVNLTAVVVNGQVSLTWESSDGAESYNVKRSNTSSGPYTTIAPSISSLIYTDTEVTAGNTYYYVVSAVNTDGESADSNEAFAAINAITAYTYDNAGRLTYITYPNGTCITFEYNGNGSLIRISRNET